MRPIPVRLAKAAKMQSFTVIDLVAVEVSSVYVSYAQSGSSKSHIVVTDTLKDIFTDRSLTFTSSNDIGTGFNWVLSFESGANVGARRLITSYSNGSFGFDVDLPFTPVLTGKEADFVRIAKYLFLAGWQQNVGYYIPDYSETTEDQPVTYLAFPMSIAPAGKNLTGEVMNMQVALSNIDKTIGNLIQNYDGLRGSRVIHMRVCDQLLNQGREYCFLDTMYIDTATITKEQVSFTLESRFNIVRVEIPIGTYNRNFCRFTFRDEFCGWTESKQGLDADYSYANRTNPVGGSPYGYTTCDHTMTGQNGCNAHKNSRRFGGFPAIPAKR